MKKIAYTFVLMLVSLAVFITSAFGWLATVSVIRTNVGGSVLTGYFAGGDGTKDNPYQLSNRTHVYNLAWLQYIGYFNNQKDPDSTKKVWQPYFIMNNDIDMAMENGQAVDPVVLPPIGTREYPFLGNFDGNNKLISNLIVSNYLGEGETAISKRPLSVTEIGDKAAIVGFFGVVGDYQGKLTDEDIYDDTGKESNTVSATNGRVNEVYDLFLDNVLVRTETAESLIGLFAGYINGSVANVGVGEGQIQVGQNVKPLEDENISAAKTLQALSLYSLVGATNFANVVWTELPKESTEGIAPTPSEGAGFGGSMNMYDLIRRLTYMYTENIAKGNIYPDVIMYYGGVRANESQKYGYRADYTYTHITSPLITYLSKDTVMPLNVKIGSEYGEEDMFKGEDIIKLVAASSSVNLTYYTNSYYSTHTTERIDASKNTGYIVGGGTGSSAIIRTRVNPLANSTDTGYPGIYRSIGREKVASKQFNSAELQCLTIECNSTNDTGTTYVILDDENGSANTAVGSIYEQKTYSTLGLSQYTTVKSGFTDSMTNDDGTGKTMLYALRFYQAQDITAETLETTTKSGVTIAGKTYDSYTFLDGAINFNLSSSGFITTLAGTYALQTGNHNMFSLYKMARNADGTIDQANCFEIKKIWVKYTDATKKKISAIAYNENGSVAQGYECAYNSVAASILSESNAMYYFELPVTEGDYALTSDSNGAYLMYLDIGANGNISFEEDGSTTTGKAEHQISGVNFVDDTVLAQNSATRAVPDEETYPVITARATVAKDTDGNFVTPTHNGLTVAFDRTGAKTMNYSVDDESEKFTVAVHTDDSEVVVTKLTAQARALMTRKKEEE